MLKIFKITAAALCLASVSGLSWISGTAQAGPNDEPDAFIIDVIADRTPRPAIGLNGLRVKDAATRREVCALTMSYAALLRHFNEMPNDSVKQVNAACIQRMTEKGWDQL